MRRLNRMKITVKTRHADPLGDREHLPRWHARHIDRTYGRSDDAREQAATLVAKKVSLHPSSKGGDQACLYAFTIEQYTHHFLLSIFLSLMYVYLFPMG